MAKRKIAETINLRVNIGKYQHIEISRYAEEEIEYETKEEIIQKEDELNSDLLDSINRGLNQFPEEIRNIEDVHILKVREDISRAIPEWMRDNQEPNLAKKKIIQDEARMTEEVGNIEKRVVESGKNMEDLFGEEPVKEPVKEASAASGSDDPFGDDDLF